MRTWMFSATSENEPVAGAGAPGFCAAADAACAGCAGSVAAAAPGVALLTPPAVAGVAPRTGFPLPWLLAGGLLVGFGTRLGSGCTSGHGICGLARLSPRSMVAVALFMGAGFATVYVLRHALGVMA